MPVRFRNLRGMHSWRITYYACRIQEPYRHAFLEDHLVSLDKVPHVSPGHDADPPRMHACQVPELYWYNLTYECLPSPLAVYIHNY
jgi:hypothetical protein